MFLIWLFEIEISTQSSEIHQIALLFINSFDLFSGTSGDANCKYDSMGYVRSSADKTVSSTDLTGDNGCIYTEDEIIV